MSSIVYSGNLVFKSDVDGAEEPGEPSAVGQIMKNLSVPMGFPRPNISPKFSRDA